MIAKSVVSYHRGFLGLPTFECDCLQIAVARTLDVVYCDYVIDLFQSSHPTLNTVADLPFRGDRATFVGALSNS